MQHRHVGGIGQRRTLGRLGRSLLRNAGNTWSGRGVRGMADHERALADLQRLAQIGTLTWDLRTGRIEWSDEIYRILGLRDGDQPTLATWRARVHPDDLEEFDAGLRDMSRSLRTYTATYRIIRRDGMVRTLECHGNVELGADGTPSRVVGTAQDITAMALAEERFRSLFQAAPYPQIVMDRTGSIMLANAAAESLFGSPSGGLGGRRAADLIPCGPELPWFLRVGEAARGGGPLDLLAARGDGTEFPVEVTLTPLVTEQGMLICAAIRDETARKQAADTLAHRASHDALTGLPNRALFLDRLEHALERARRSRRTLAVMFLDLDDFKLVNDTRGHDVGDLLLVALTPRLRTALRPGDTIARFGGDEFVVLCEDLSEPADARIIADRIAEACRGPVMIGDCEHVVTVSAGVVIVSDPDAATPSRVLRDADAAMYRAKDRGKGHTEIFDEGMRTRLVERVAIEGSLRTALEHDEFRLSDDVEQGIRSLSELKGLGVRLVLDDFGTGYSSLSYLRRLTIDALKIDRSFVDGLGRGTADGAIVGAVLSLADALGLGVTAEGVETQAQLSRLRQHGCEYAQGFLFCHPSPADEVSELLSAAERADGCWCEGAVAPSAAV